MPTVNKYRIHCTAESKDEFLWAETPPTTCPVNTAHAVDANSIAIVDTLKSELRETRAVLSPGGLKLSSFGFKFTATKAALTTHDHKLEQPVKLRGGIVETKEHEMGDTITLEIVDKDGIMSPAGTVLSDYFTNWNVPQSGREEILEISVGDTIPKDLYVRAKYNSVGSTNDVKVGVNFRGYKG